MGDMTPEYRKVLRKARGHGYVDAVTGLAYQNRLPDHTDEGQRACYEIGWHAGRAEHLGIPVPKHLNIVDPEDYAKFLFCEEAGEALQMIGKGGRFGDDTPGRLDAEGRVIVAETPRTELAKEIGDVLAAIEYAQRSGLISRTAVERHRERKLAKLLSPRSRDNEGRRLAPPPSGWDDPQRPVLADLANDPLFVEAASVETLLGRRIVGFSSATGEYEFPAWIFSDATMLVLPLAGGVRSLTWQGEGRSHLAVLRPKIVSVQLDADRFEIIAIDSDQRSQRWSLETLSAPLGTGDDVGKSMAIMRAPSN